LGLFQISEDLSGIPAVYGLRLFNGRQEFHCLELFFSLDITQRQIPLGMINIIVVIVSDNLRKRTRGLRIVAVLEI